MGSDLPTPSQLHRVHACVRSETIEPVLTTHRWASRGTIAHRYLANVLAEGKHAALEREHPSDRNWLEQIDIERLPAFHPSQYAPEVAFAWNPWTGEARELGRNLTREQAHAMRQSGEMVGIADVVGVTPTYVDVHDYKTGRGYVDPAEINWQVKTYALMAARAYGKQMARVHIQRALDDGTVWHDSAQLDLFDLEAHGDQVLRLVEWRAKVREMAATGAPLPPFHVGQHCTYCPALSRCPPNIEALVLLAQVAPDGKGVSALDGKVLELAGDAPRRAWEWLKVIEKRVGAAQEVMRSLARQAPIELAGGKFLGEYQHAAETIQPGPAEKVLTERYGPLGAAVHAKAVEKEETLTKASLKTALRSIVLPTLPGKDADGKKWGITRLVDEAEEALRQGGAMAVKVSTRVGEHTPEAEEPAPALPESAEAA